MSQCSVKVGNKHINACRKCVWESRKRLITQNDRCGLSTVKENCTTGGIPPCEAEGTPSTQGTTSAGQVPRTWKIDPPREGSGGRGGVWLGMKLCCAPPSAPESAVTFLPLLLQMYIPNLILFPFVDYHSSFLLIFLDISAEKFCVAA